MPQKPPRVAVVVHTADGRRLKPECPICQSVSWATPIPPGVDKAGFQHVIAADLGKTLLTLPINRWLCMNCGFLWERMNIDGVQAGRDDADASS